MRCALGSLVAILAGLLGACSHLPNPSGPDGATTPDELAAKTVALVGYDDDGNAHAYCSGVWVGAKAILTAAHCVRNDPFAALLGKKDEIRFSVRSDVFGRDGTQAKYPVTRTASRVRVDEDVDLALLTTDNAPDHYSVARVSAAWIAAGDVAQTMGHPKGYWWSYSAGNVAAVRQDPGAGESPQWWIQTTAPISSGNSGCGLFDGQGRLIGIASWGNFGRGSSNLGFFVHRDTIVRFLKAAS